MKIFALVTDAYGGFGGIAQYNRDFLDALCSFPEIEQVIAVPRIAPEPTGRMPTKLIYALGGARGPVSFTVQVLRRGLLGPSPDLVVCGHFNLLPLALLIARLRGARLLMLIYGIDAWRPTGRLSDRLTRFVDIVVSISHVTLDRYLKHFAAPRDRSEILPNAINLDAYGPGRKAPDLVERFGLAGRTVLMTFGRLAGAERAKGFDEIIEILPRLRLRDPSIVYVIVGTGDDRERLQAKAEQLGLSDSVVFTGRVPEERKADYFRLADAYVMPSSGEGFGFVLLEAMACGVPVLASRSDGGYEAIRGGILGEDADPTDPESVFEGIFRTLSRPRGVPEGLDYFALPQFRSRLRSILLRIRGSAA